MATIYETADKRYLTADQYNAMTPAQQANVNVYPSTDTAEGRAYQASLGNPAYMTNAGSASSGFGTAFGGGFQNAAPTSNMNTRLSGRTGGGSSFANMTPTAGAGQPTTGGMVLDPSDPRYYSQFSDSTQTGTTFDQQTGSSLAQSLFGNTEMGQQFTSGLTQEQQIELQNILQQMSSLTQQQSMGQTTGQTQVTDPINFLQLLQQEQAIAEADTLPATQALVDIVSGGQPIEVDRQAFLDLQNQQIRDAVNQATRGQAALGAGDTDVDRLAAAATARAAAPTTAQLAQLELDAAVNDLAARVQAGEIISGGGAGTQLVAQALQPLTELFGTETVGTTQETSTQQVEEQMTQQISSMMQRMAQTEEFTQTLGESLGWSQDQIEEVNSLLSQSIAQSSGLLSGIAPVQESGGKYICTVCVNHGFIEVEKLNKELAVLRENPDLFTSAREGYDIWGFKAAEILSERPKLAKLVAPMAEAFMDYILGKRNLGNKLMFHSVVKFSEFVAFLNKKEETESYA